MSRFWRMVMIGLIGFSVQFCGKSGANNPSIESDSPPPGLPTVTAAQFQSDAQKADLAEKNLPAGFQFTSSKDQNGQTKWDWDHTALLKLLAQNPDGGLENLLPVLQSYCDAMKPFIDEYGKGYMEQESNGQTTWIHADADPLRMYNRKYKVATESVARIKADSLHSDGTNEAAPDLDVRGTAPGTAPRPVN